MAAKPIKVMTSSSVYGAQSLLMQVYAPRLGFGYLRQKDRSLAIAHGHEFSLWHEAEEVVAELIDQ